MVFLHLLNSHCGYNIFLFQGGTLLLPQVHENHRADHLVKSILQSHPDLNRIHSPVYLDFLLEHTQNCLFHSEQELKEQ